MRIDIVTIFPDYFGPVDPDRPGRVGASGPLGVSLIGKAAARGDIDFRLHDLRRWTTDIHHTVDDTPFGGGPGMVMKPDVWGAALDDILSSASPADPTSASASGPAPTSDNPDSPPAPAPTAHPGLTADPSVTSGPGLTADPGAASGPGLTADPGAISPADPRATCNPTVNADPTPTSIRTRPARLVVPSPSGTPFTQELAAEYAAERHLIFACGRYEGIDSRVVTDARTRMTVDEVSIGDYVLAGGEAAVAVMVEAICRLLPGVLGNEQSAADDSFGGAGGAMSGLLEGPVYTRPRSWRGLEVPDVLLSGHHQAIARWQRDEALRRTAAIRPDLIRRLAAAGGLGQRDRQVLAQAGFPVEGGFPVDGESMAH
jgi:tRNA (guanine-N1)-methyltransferase